jgi:hypothetical protein
MSRFPPRLYTSSGRSSVADIPPIEGSRVAGLSRRPLGPQHDLRTLQTQPDHQIAGARFTCGRRTPAPRARAVTWLSTGRMPDGPRLPALGVRPNAVRRARFDVTSASMAAPANRAPIALVMVYLGRTEPRRGHSPREPDDGQIAGQNAAHHRNVLGRERPPKAWRSAGRRDAPSGRRHGATPPAQQQASRSRC